MCCTMEMRKIIICYTFGSASGPQSAKRKLRAETSESNIFYTFGLPVSCFMSSHFREKIDKIKFIAALISRLHVLHEIIQMYEKQQ